MKTPADFKYERLDRSGYSRTEVCDRYVRAHCTGMTDVSPRYSGPYVGKCGMCWLGNPHTADYHAQAIK